MWQQNIVSLWNMVTANVSKWDIIKALCRNWQNWENYMDALPFCSSEYLIQIFLAIVIVVIPTGILILIIAWWFRKFWEHISLILQKWFLEIILKDTANPYGDEK